MEQGERKALNDDMLFQDFSTWLEHEFSCRCDRNPRYSLRSFANYLDIDASSLSQYMSRKRKPSSKMISRLCDKLGASPDQEELFLNAVDLKSVKIKNSKYTQIDLDKFYFISDWYHISILELTQLKDFRSTAQNIAMLLGITLKEAQDATKRLERLDLIQARGPGFVKTAKSLSNFKPGMTSRAHRNYQKQIIKKALESIDMCSPEEKDITSISMAVDESKIPAARKLIEEFRKKMCDFLEDGKQTRVFNLSVQLFPISKKDV